MDITLKLLAEELSAFYPNITVCGDENRRLLRLAPVAELPVGAVDTLYIGAAEELPAASPEGVCLAVVGRFCRPVPAGTSWLVIPNGTAVGDVFSRIQEIFLRFWRWYAELLQAAQNNEIQALLDVTAPLFPSGISLLSVYHNRVFCSDSASDTQARWERIFLAYSEPEAQIEGFPPFAKESDSLQQGAHFVSDGQGESFLVCHVFLYGVRWGTFFAAITPEEAKSRHFLCMNELTRAAQRMFAAVGQHAGDPLTLALQRMLEGNRLAPSELESLCRTAGWAASGHTYRVMVIRADEQAAQSFRRQQLLYQKVIASIYYRSKTLRYRDEIVVVRDFTVHDAFEEAENSLEKLNYFLEQCHATMGASAPFSELSQLYPFYEQARMLAAASKHTSAAMHEYSNYLPYDMVRSFAETHSLDHHIHPEIRKLAELEEKGSADLLLSLYLYLLNDRSYQTCAEKLNLHRNSFAYRINKVLSALACDWNDENVRLSLLLSICMYWYQHPKKDPIGIARWNNFGE